MIVTQGGRFGGYGFYLLKGKPVFLWNLVDLKRLRWEGTTALSPGKHVLEFDFTYDGLGMGTLAFNNLSGIGQRGTGVLKVDGQTVATHKDGANSTPDPSMGRKLRCRRGYGDSRGRRRLSSSLPVQRYVGSINPYRQPSETVPGGRTEIMGGTTE